MSLSTCVIVLCVVKRDNVIFALTRHGGHLGYFEGGVVRPNSLTWLDRVIVEFSTALLRCKTTSSQQQRQTYTTNSLYSNCEPSAKKSPMAAAAADVQQQKKQEVEESASPTVASCKADIVDKLAASVVADILRVSASVCSSTEEAMQNGTLANDVATVKNTNPLSK